jgi:hypothetical protein
VSGGGVQGVLGVATGVGVAVAVATLPLLPQLAITAPSTMAAKAATIKFFMLGLQSTP